MFGRKIFTHLITIDLRIISILHKVAIHEPKGIKQ